MRKNVRGVTRVGFLSDVEGNLEYLRKACAFSSVVKVKKDVSDEVDLDFRDHSSAFVFGGDVCDHGQGDLRIANALVNFKRKYPERVFLLTGNRDLNKIYLNSTLWPTWKRSREETVSECQKLLLKMGAPNAFEFRRKELQEITQSTLVSDEEVTESFVESVNHGGFMLNFLSHAQLGAIVGDTLFVHGAVPECGVGYVPETRRSGKVYKDCHQWINALNAFYNGQVQKYTDSLDPKQVSLLTEYGRPGGVNGKGVIYNDWLRKGDTLPDEIPAKVSSFLLKSGIRRVLSGHRPNGDTPTIIKDSQSDFTVITADTSYSDQNAADHRGGVVSEVLVEFGMEGSRAILSGRRADGSDYCFVSEEDERVGRAWPNSNGWTKALLRDKSYLVCYSKGPGSWSSELKYSIEKI